MANPERTVWFDISGLDGVGYYQRRVDTIEEVGELVHILQQGSIVQILKVETISTTLAVGDFED